MPSLILQNIRHAGYATQKGGTELLVLAPGKLIDNFQHYWDANLARRLHGDGFAKSNGTAKGPVLLGKAAAGST